MNDYVPGSCLTASPKASESIRKEIERGLKLAKEFALEDKTEPPITALYMEADHYRKFFCSDRKFLICDPDVNDGYAKGDRLNVTQLNGENSILVDVLGGTQIIRPSKLSAAILASCRYKVEDLADKPYVGITKVQEVEQ